MIRGTTPTHVFLVDISLENIDKLYVTYKQNKNTIVEKTLDDVEIDNDAKTISVHLTQAETLLFKDLHWSALHPNLNSKDDKIQVQIRIKYDDGTALASNIILLPIDDILKDGEI